MIASDISFTARSRPAVCLFKGVVYNWGQHYIQFFRSLALLPVPERGQCTLYSRQGLVPYGDLAVLFEFEQGGPTPYPATTDHVSFQQRTRSGRET